MLHTIPELIKKRMQYLEVIDARDRQDGTPTPQRLRQIPPETGKFIALLACNAPPGDIIEIGTSAGYSTLWLALACHQMNRKITTFEILPEKCKMARETFILTRTTDLIKQVHGSALDHLPALDKIAFCFLDADKDIYEMCYDLVIPRMVKGGILIADNVISHAQELKSMIDKALTDQRVDALIVPIGNGELFCRKA